jgi:hypothetical protein
MRRQGPAWRLGVALLLVASAATADYKDDYRRGLEAQARKDWAEAARLMRAAIAERPQEEGLLSSGLLRRYTPHYHLGVALAELGDCRAAVEAFDSSERQGKIAKEELRDLTVRREACRQRITRTQEAASAARREVDAAAAAAFEVARLESAPVMRSVWSGGSPSYASRQQPEVARLAAARAALARGERELSEERVAEAGRLAQEARRALEALAREAGARRDELQTQVEGELGEMHKAVDAARRDLDFASRSLGPLPPDLARRAQALQDALQAAQAADIGTPLAVLQELQDRLRREVRALRAGVRAPPEELQEAATAYFAGDFATAVSLLAGRSFPEARATAHACLLHAAALYGATRTGGGDTLDPVREELRRCRALPGRVRLVEQAFPPGFRALHAEVAAEPAP